MRRMVPNFVIAYKIDSPNDRFTAYGLMNER